MPLSETDALLFRQLCIEAEMRCSKRSARRAERHDDSGSRHFADLASQYQRLRATIAENSGTLDTSSVLKDIVRLANKEQDPKYHAG
jgi:hypothetical protein